MAKSTRSKVKRAYRAKKRENGVFAAAEAARLQRLSTKLAAVRDADIDGDVTFSPLNPGAEDVDGDESIAADSMAIDIDSTSTNPTTSAVAVSTSSSTTTKKVSTHGPRISRRTEWRVSKGLAARPKSRGMNRQGSVAAKSRSGRAHRRR